MRRTGLRGGGQGKKETLLQVIWDSTLVWKGDLSCHLSSESSGSPVGVLPADLEEEVQLDPDQCTFPSPAVTVTFLGGRLKSHREEIEVMVYNEIGFITGNQGSECSGSKLNLVKTTMDTTSTVLACYVLSHFSHV